jgi:DNA-binding MarR family transcriptional regulator
LENDTEIISATDKNLKEAAVINYLNANKFITNKNVCGLLKISDAAAKRLLQSMVKKELITAEGENKGRIYKNLHKPR